MTPARPTVFIIDDDDSVRGALCRLLRSAGLEVQTFASAEEFLAVAAPGPPACLVLDVHLPGLSGPQLLQRLRAEARDLPVVFISAYQEDPELSLGAVAFLRKPFDQQALVEAVQRALAQA